MSIFFAMIGVLLFADDAKLLENPASTPIGIGLECTIFQIYVFMSPIPFQFLTFGNTHRFGGISDDPASLFRLFFL